MLGVGVPVANCDNDIVCVCVGETDGEEEALGFGLAHRYASPSMTFPRAVFAYAPTARTPPEIVDKDTIVPKLSLAAQSGQLTRGVEYGIHMPSTSA